MKNLKIYGQKDISIIMGIRDHKLLMLSINIWIVEIRVVGFLELNAVNVTTNIYYLSLVKEGKIFDITIENMKTWHHSGFNVYCGPSIFLDGQDGITNLARYIIRAPISQKRMFYIPAEESLDGIAKVIFFRIILSFNTLIYFNLLFNI